MGFQQGLSGLNASAKNLDVIGHNIANSNTTGFKSSRAEFSAMVNSAMGLAGGGRNGIGVETAAVAQQFNQGGITVTGNSLDVAVNGNGFFTVQMPDGSRAYTRDGAFQLRANGDIISNGGAQLMGYAIDPDTGLRASSTAAPLRLPTSAPIPAKQTTEIKAALNLDARTKNAAGDPAATPPVPATPRATYGTSLNVYDSQGVATPVNLYFMKTGENEWEVYTTLDESVQADGDPAFTVTFDDNGRIESIDPPPAGSAFEVELTIDSTASNPNQLDPYNVMLNLDGITQFGTKFAVSDLQQDGYTAGQLTGVHIGDDGMVMARYSNGIMRAEGQLMLASFRNTQGLQPMGGNTWVETHESGQPAFGAPGDGNFGLVRSGALEDSNVDLTAELVNMMTAQRAYQANAQTIKTQDQVLSTIVNLR